MSYPKGGLRPSRFALVCLVMVLAACSARGDQEAEASESPTATSSTVPASTTSNPDAPSTPDGGGSSTTTTLVPIPWEHWPTWTDQRTLTALLPTVDQLPSGYNETDRPFGFPTRDDLPLQLSLLFECHLAQPLLPFGWKPETMIVRHFEHQDDLRRISVIFSDHVPPLDQAEVLDLFHDELNACPRHTEPWEDPGTVDLSVSSRLNPGRHGEGLSVTLRSRFDNPSMARPVTLYQRTDIWEVDGLVVILQATDGAEGDDISLTAPVERDLGWLLEYRIDLEEQLDGLRPG